MMAIRTAAPHSARRAAALPAPSAGAQLPQVTGTGRLDLQVDDPHAPLWERVLPAAVWRQAIGPAPVRLEVHGGPAELLGARDGRLVLHRRVTGSTHVTCEAADHLWLRSEAPVSARWSVRTDLRPPQVTVVMPTYRREADACAQAARFAAMELVSQVIVVDQGGTLAGHPALAALPDPHRKVRVVTQRNLGGSGGYARGMLESLSRPEDAVLLSDDDAVIGEESLRRMLVLQCLAPRPTIVGTPLFDAAEPDRLLALWETVDPRTVHWRAADGLRGSLSLAGTTPLDWGVLEPRMPARYTGWWGTLLPPGAVSRVGLPAPYFLKWDDAEHGLRAQERGYQHLVLPGTAVHHPGWTAHGTQMSWAAQLMHRNRLATAAAHGRGLPGAVASSLAHQVKHVLAGHHLTATLWAAGIDDLLAGPAWLGTDLNRVRERAEATVRQWRAEHPAPDLDPDRARPPRRPLPAALRALRILLRPAGAAPPSASVVRLRAAEVTWRTTLGADAVLVVDEHGQRVDAFTVDGAEGRRLLRRALRQHAALLLRAPALRRRYRTALRRSVTAEAWRQVLR